LISKNLSYSVLRSYTDDEENILGITVEINDCSIRLFSIYGPNHDNKSFYNKIDEFLKEEPLLPVVLGGDWNVSYSTSNTDSNIDILNMRSPPSLVRSAWLRQVCTTHHLSDPFRALHPTRRDFTYVPRGARTNRSRLDFFLICDELIGRISTCEIPEVLTTSFLDHKPVKLDFTREKTKPRPFINRTILNNPRTEDIVLASFMDTYLSHADMADNANLELVAGVHHAEGINRLLQERERVGNLFSKIREYNTAYEQLALDPTNNLLSLECAAKNTEITLLKDNLLPPETVTQLKLDADADFFLESLMSNVKGNVVSFQQWVKKTENSLKSRLVSRLNTLKIDYINNVEQITVIEEQLQSIIDKELNEKVKSMKIFECLNAEKPTPLFMSLARTRSVTKKLSMIKKEDGSPYTSNEERIEGIVKYYEDLYKKPVNDIADYANCVENFLGPEIVGSAIVQGSMLTEAERNSLDLPLTIEEIDKSMEKANFKSAPGMDGLSNKFLKKYWRFFRHALHNYATNCFEKNRLTPNFLSASIKLIPKKGDMSNLKNWRPISLLSNMYKIISRAINNRLNKVVNRICSRAQKGFNDCRYTQEVLINVIETIRHCNSNGISGAVVAVDMAKAFDTLSHGYLTEVFKFFKFGPNMIKWLNLLGTNRTACIILDDCSYSRNFDLGRGRAQGDNISPNTFDFGDQILIFKIEMDPQVSAVWQHLQPPNNNHLLQAEHHQMPDANTDFFRNESRRETGKNESLADDNTTLTILDYSNLHRLREILDEFARISGLHCNYDKTCILPVGPPVENVNTAGFVITDKIKLLGMDITADFNNTDEIFLNIHEKIVNLISFWDRFRLTLPGRISVLKNLLIPQINYLGCILTPSRLTLDRIQETVDNFALGIKRAHFKCIDNWRFDLHQLSPNNDITQIRKIDIDPYLHPILTNIVNSYCEFLPAFSKNEKNYRKAHIFLNPAFVRSGSDNGLIDIPFFTREIYERSKNGIRALTYEDCFDGTNFKTLAQFQELGINLTNVIWMRLQAAMLFAKKEYRSNENAKSSLSITEFLTGFKKGSKKFRNAITKQKIAQSNVTELRIVNTFSELTDTVVPDSETVKFHMGLWNCAFLPNDFREFIFKERNNCLRLNNRVANFRQNVSDKCCFCRIINPDTGTRESFSHLFLECPVTRVALNGFLRLSGNILQGNNPEIKNILWYGILNGNLDKDAALVMALFKFCIWKSKLRKRIPRALEIYDLIQNLLATIVNLRPKIRLSMSNNIYFSNLLQARG